MATATKTAKAFTVRFEISGNEVEDAEPWVVYTPDGDFESCHSSEAEAIAYCAECNETLAEEWEEEERSELIDVLQEKIADMDLAELRNLAKKLGLV